MRNEIQTKDLSFISVRIFYTCITVTISSDANSLYFMTSFIKTITQTIYQRNYVT